MDNVIPLNVRLKQREDAPLVFKDCVELLSKSFEEKQLEPGKWLMIVLGPDGVPMISLNGFQQGEIYILLDAVKDWLKRP